jgi:hypothetical protein
MAGTAMAQLPMPASTNFDITGFIQEATLDGPVPASGVAHQGGHIKVNGHVIIVPSETVVIFPANALTWQEIFAQAPAPYGPTQSGMAMADVPAPLTTYEGHVVGNRVLGGPGGADVYIAGLIYISQQDLNSGAGFINFINYSLGELRIGGPLGVEAGARVRINDPFGRYGRTTTTPDPRFTVDPDNPTIMAGTGYPMCLPRVTADPNVAGAADDPACPKTQRPLAVAPATGFATTIDTVPGGFPDPTLQVPFEVGDYVTFAGTLVADCAAGAAGCLNGGTTAGPWPAGGTAATWVAAHTIVNNVAVYTAPGTNPAYVMTEVTLIGTGGLTVLGLGEAVIRTRFEGMTTDVDPTGAAQRIIHLYGMDIDPTTGAITDRDWGTIGVDPGPPNGAVKGRWRFRPPCLPFGTVPTKPDKQCVMNQAGSFLPPTREMRAVIEGLQSQNPASPTAVTSANGIFYGQYHAPILEYIFPENVPGTPIVENNFNTIGFLANGGYTSAAGTQVGQLNPWPSSVTPPPQVCAVPTIIGSPYSVANGGSITLSGSVNADATAPITLLWTAGTTAGGTDLNGALTNAASTTPSFNATGLAAGTYFLTFTATNACGGHSAAGTIAVQAAPPPTVNPIQNQTVTAGLPVTVVASSASLPAPRWTWTQTAGPVNPVAFNQTPTAATASASSQITFTPTVAGTYTFSVTATNTNGTSQPTPVTITVTATVPANIVVTPAEYRIGKQRLVLTATTPDLATTSVTLLPYLTETGTTFDPATLGASAFTVTGGPGVWTLTAVGAPKPACNLGGAYATPCAQRPLTVKAFINGVVSGTSAPTALDRIRQ